MQREFENWCECAGGCGAAGASVREGAARHTRVAALEVEEGEKEERSGLGDGPEDVALLVEGDLQRGGLGELLLDLDGARLDIITSPESI